MVNNAGNTTVRVKICGEEHPIKGDASNAYIQQLAELVDKRFQQIQKKNLNLPRHKVAILVALNLADELESLKKEHQDLVDLMEEIQ